MKNVLLLLRDRRTVIASTATALAAFFCIHSYFPAAGVIGNATRGQIYLTDKCERPPSDPVSPTKSGALTFDDLAPHGTTKPVDYDPFAPPRDPESCIVKLPYRFILIAMIGLIAAHLMLRHGTKL